MLRISGGGPRYRHSSQKLLAAIRVGSKVKGGHDGLALCLVVPECMRAPFLESMRASPGQKSNAWQSASLMHRGELEKGQVFRIAWADSSPIAGFDWIWSHYHEIRQRDVVAVFLSVRQLHWLSSAASSSSRR